MYDIPTDEATQEFAECWQAAGKHLETQVQGGIQSWLRAHLDPPFLEHLSFRLGNQLFFIRIVDSADRLEVPGSLQGLLSIADGCKGHACLLPMKKRLLGGWETARTGWGLIDARSGSLVDPIDLVSDEKIEMTDWELHDFAVQIVRDQLIADGYPIISFHDNPGVFPSLWFDGDSGEEWVIVTACRFPEEKGTLPNNWHGIREQFGRRGKKGHVAHVGFANADNPFEPLWRGYGTHVRFCGLEDA